MSARKRGADHPNAKLTQEQVDTIRESRLGPSELARRFGVSKATVSLIRRNVSWRPGPQEVALARSAAALGAASEAVSNSPHETVAPASCRAGVAPGAFPDDADTVWSEELE
jgi:transcriptional regulator with XRE-family HTH domain